MRLRSVHRFFLCIVMLWLPLQGYAAVIMPFCQHALGDAGGAPMSGDQEHQHHDGKAANGEHHHGHDTKGFACNDCGACHLACCSSILPSPVSLGLPLSDSAFLLASPATV